MVGHVFYGAGPFVLMQSCHASSPPATAASPLLMASMVCPFPPPLLLLSSDYHLDHPHYQFIYFLSPVPQITFWIMFLDGFESLAGRCQSEYGLKFFKTVQFNLSTD